MTQPENGILKMAKQMMKKTTTKKKTMLIEYNFKNTLYH